MRSRTWRWTSSAESSHARSFINLCCGICEASCASLAVTVICVLLWLVRRHLLKTVVFQIPNKTCSFRSLDATLSGHWLMVSVMLLTQDNWLLVNVMLLTQVSWLMVSVMLLTQVRWLVVSVTLLSRVSWLVINVTLLRSIDSWSVWHYWLWSLDSWSLWCYWLRSVDS